MKSSEKEDVNLRDVIRVVLKRKKVVLSIFFLIVVCTIISIFSSRKIYEVRATIQRGFINAPVLTYQETEAIIKSVSFLKPIFEKLNVSSLQELQGNDVKKNIIVEEIKETNFFVLKIRLNNNDLGYSLIQEIINAYLERGNTIYNRQNNLMRDHIGLIDSLIEKTKLNVDKSTLVKKENALLFAYPDDKVYLLSQKFQLETQLLLAKEFKLIDKPVKPECPVPSKKVLIIISSCIMALMIGIFCAFLVEDWYGTKKIGEGGEC